MNKGNLPDNQWPKGQSGNPAGRPRVPEIVKQIRSTDLAAMAEIITKVLNMPAREAAEKLNEIKKKLSEASVFEAKVLQFALNGGVQELDFLISRVYGRPRQSRTPETNVLEERIQKRIQSSEPAEIIDEAYKSIGIEK